MDYNKDQTCDPNILKVPPISAFYNTHTDLNDFLCQLMQAAANDSIDPTLIQGVAADATASVNYKALTAVGDHRFRDGDIIKAAFTNFLPKLVAQVEVKAAGGTQIIDKYICDADGNVKKESETIPILTTVGSQGMKIYGYDIEGGLDPQKLLEPFKQTDVLDFVQGFISDKSKEHADDFITYLQLHYPRPIWKANLHAFKYPAFFYIGLDHVETGTVLGTVYLKYHPEMQDYIAQKLTEIGYLPEDASIDVKINGTFDNNVIAEIFLQSIPNYSQAIKGGSTTDIFSTGEHNTGDRALDLTLYAVDNFLVMPEEQYNNLATSGGVTVADFNKAFFKK